MAKVNVACSDTVLLIRLGDCPAKDLKEMQKTARATFDFDISSIFSMLYFSN